VKIKSPSDFWCGLIFLAIGVAFMLLAREYRMGTAARIGPGYFPTLLGGVLAALGLSITLPSFLVAGEPLPRVSWRPLLMILISILVFGLLLEPAGLAVAVAALVVVSGLADRELRLRESLALALFLVAFSIGIFVTLLGLPLNLWPSL
jgi:Tripartite tricarboxylate transporter TctB family